MPIEATGHDGERVCSPLCQLATSSHTTAQAALARFAPQGKCECFAGYTGATCSVLKAKPNDCNKVGPLRCALGA